MAVQASLFVFFGFATFFAAAALSAPAPQNEACLNCHERLQDSMNFSDGSKQSLQIARELWAKSVHGRGLLCVDCHSDVAPGSHPKKKYKNYGEYRTAKAVACKTCHLPYFLRATESIHAHLRKAGNRLAPTCPDCHAVHRMAGLGTLYDLNAKCGSCHHEVYEQYKTSVHGKALENGDNHDVPGCIHCHTAHSNEDPRTAAFHSRIHSLCANCHSNEEVMRRNKLTTAAYTTYVDDFHGHLNAGYARQKGIPTKVAASCTDCHGVHQIQSFKNTAAAIGRIEIRKTLAGKCRQCHEQANENFAAAWLSHYPPRPDTAPVLWGLKKFYGFFNPFMVVIFVVTLLLDLYRFSIRPGEEGSL